MKFARTTDGKIHRIVMDDCRKEKMELVDDTQWIDNHGNYDLNKSNVRTYHYSDILVSDQNLSIVKRGQ